MPKVRIDAAISEALGEADSLGITGKETTPFLLARIVELTGGESLESNVRLVLNNAGLAARVAVSYSALS
jgi:pseudouridine-5'-phosphate glycosidase